MATLEQIKKEPKTWQRLLNCAGYDTGGIDGILGTKSRAAEACWLAEHEKDRKEIGAVDDRSERTLLTVLPVVARKVRKLLIELRKQGDWKAIIGTRTYSEQDKLYSQRPKVTNAKGGQSYHNFGLAVDLCLFVDGKDIWTDRLYQIIGKYTPAVGLEWGGAWKFTDNPHVQLTKGTTAQARANFESGKTIT